MTPPGPGCEVALVSMPWGPPLEPCLGLGILKSCLNRAGISARVFHFASEMLRWTTMDTYQYLADSWGLNEFVFTAELDPKLGVRQQEAVVRRVQAYHRAGRDYGAYPAAENILDLIMTARHEVVPKLLAEAAQRIQESGAKVVGFTCLFDQTMASLALASVLKKRDPGLTVIFGGYALEGAPGQQVVNAFPCVDHLVVGDGEQEIVNLATWALASGRGSGTAPPRVVRAQKYPINDSPVPDYDDWFRDLDSLHSAHAVRINTEVLPVESSRGCWWGQTKHCVFCGIDDDTLKYRFKEPKRTLDMLEQLTERHGDVMFRFSDYILPKAYYTDLLPQLAKREPCFRLHAEIKANQPPERVKLLVRAGFVAVQPGIESFATSALREMDKGVRGIDNVCLLKAGYAEQLVVHYNILYGLPGDDVTAYEEMSRQIPRIYHLMPPISRTETVVTRFAPLQLDPGRFGIGTAPEHHECYDVMFSEEFLASSGFRLDDYGYYFKRNFEYSDELRAAYRNLVFQVDHWKEIHRLRFVELTYKVRGDAFRITDTRFSDGDSYDLSAAASAILRAAGSRPVNIHRIPRGKASAEEFDAALEELDRHRLIWREGDLILGLPLPERVSDRYRETEWPKQWDCLYV
ncbi:RiPP maturation radical SAM C-methyltransferase [Streptomyces sp. NPDC004111]|uniref:RiPP maturation radical SAM C-methyltransferase n=1 Tax=Streptomyces sp. NPDC004111 TaxID=3364690 RepID=UPI00368BBD8C